MELTKLIYQVREKLGAISDDRHIDERYITNAIDIVRADYLRKTLTRAPGYNTNSLTQDIVFDLEIVSRSMVPDTCPLNCVILRSTTKVPSLIYYGTLGNWWSLRTVDVAYRWLEPIEQQRAGYLSFEFNVGYGFIGTDNYLYMLFNWL